MWRPKELINRSYSSELVSRIDQDTGIARECGGIAGNGDNAVGPAGGNALRLNTRAGARRVKYQGIVGNQFRRFQWSVRQVAGLNAETVP